MRIGLLLLMLTGCAGSPTQPQAPQSPPESAPGPQLSNEVRAQLDALEAPFRAPETVVARLNEEVRFGDIRVKPLQILEDSRCPQDVDCVWAGRIRVRVAVSGVGEPVMELNRPVIVEWGVQLSLVAVAPANWTRPPPGVDPHAPPRFAFRLGGMD